MPLPVRFKSDRVHQYLQRQLGDGETVLWVCENCSASPGHLMRYWMYLIIGGLFAGYLGLSVYSAYHPPFTITDFLVGAITLAVMALLVGIPALMLLRRNHFAYALTSNRLIVMNVHLADAMGEITPDEITQMRLIGSPENGTLILYDYPLSNFLWQRRLWLPRNKLSDIENPADVAALIQQTFNLPFGLHGRRFNTAQAETLPA